jgi:hypothetical protein
MANIINLDVLGKNISDDFVQNGVSMTKSLIKVAQESGLNKHQISRVAEVANVEAYLKLMKTASNKYIQFPVADAGEVVTEISKKAEVNNLIDYEKNPGSTTKVESIFAAYEELNKTASIWSNPISYKDESFQISLTKEAMDIMSSKTSSDEKIKKLKESSLIKEADGSAVFKYKGKDWNLVLNAKSMNILQTSSSTDSKFNSLTSLGLITKSKKDEISKESEFRKIAQCIEASTIKTRNELHDMSSSFPDEVMSLYGHIKQASLSGYNPKDIIEIVKQASELVSNLVSEPIVNKLKIEAPHLDYESFHNFPINTNSDIYKIAKLLENKILEIAQKENEVCALETKYASYVKECKLPNLVSVMLEHYQSPLVKEAVVSATPVLAAFIAGELMGQSVGKNKGKREQGRVLQEALLQNNTGAK